ncbi:MAG: hypothetical protein WC299_13010 [Kiritimatiellia bacterium]
MIVIPMKMGIQTFGFLPSPARQSLCGSFAGRGGNDRLNGEINEKQNKKT